ncbi:MAG: hypothetical protein WA131_04770 [Desulfitobacteriaceae bacterium]
MIGVKITNNSAAYNDTWDYGCDNNFEGVISRLTLAAYDNSQKQMGSSNNFGISSIPVESHRSQLHINVFVKNFMDMINFVDTSHVDQTLFQPSPNKVLGASTFVKLFSETEAELMKTPNSRKLHSGKSIKSSVTHGGPLKAHRLDRLESDVKRVITTKPYLSCKSILSEVTNGGPLPRKPQR